jgi:hypothetical protein
MPALGIFRPFNLTGSRQNLQKLGQVHGISKVLRSRNNAKGTCQVRASKDNLSSYDSSLSAVAQISAFSVFIRVLFLDAGVLQ